LKKAIFLDRDGIINIDKSYVYKKEDFEFYDGVFKTLRHFQSLGYILIIITNQSGIGRGYYTEEDFQKLMAWVKDEFKKQNIDIKAIYHCPHKPDENCTCRKPKPKMIESAIKKYNIDTDASWMIGDKQSDIQAGNNANITNTILVNTIICKDAKYIVKSILDTINIIKK